MGTRPSGFRKLYFYKRPRQRRQQRRPQLHLSIFARFSVFQTAHLLETRRRMPSETRKARANGRTSRQKVNHSMACLFNDEVHDLVPYSLAASSLAEKQSSS